jgi:hypothetical protein
MIWTPLDRNTSRRAERSFQTRILFVKWNYQLGITCRFIFTAVSED